MFIKCDFGIRIIYLHLSYPAVTWSFMSRTIAASFSGIPIAFSLLDSIDGFLICCKSTILQPSHAVSGLKDPKQFCQKQEVFFTHNLFVIEGKAACNFIEPPTDSVPLYYINENESEL